MKLQENDLLTFSLTVRNKQKSCVGAEEKTLNERQHTIHLRLDVQRMEAVTQNK